MESGLYADLVKDGLLVEHAEVALAYKMTPDASIVIRPRPIPLISYPYEWCFGQLREAALLTLAIQRRALKFGLTLRDGSAFNVQFEGTKPVFIDTLAFQKLRDPQAWPGYEQFCRHFVAPLGLMSQIDVRLAGLLRMHVDGIPLDLAAQLLPWSTRIGGGLRRHIHQQTKSPTPESERTKPRAKPGDGSELSTQLALLDDLEETVRGAVLLMPAVKSPSVSARDGFDEKTGVILTWLNAIKPKTVWDLCFESGEYANLGSEVGAHTTAFSPDPFVVESHFSTLRAQHRPLILPLVLNWANPSPGGGWAGTERSSIFERGPADGTIALNIFHALTIVNDVPMIQVAEFLNRISRHLIVEFPTSKDSEVERLVALKGCHNEEYSRSYFEAAFARNFSILESKTIAGGTRFLYFMESTG
jgi:hypothetical protein